jgi:8-oxo-dGTP diphosphatase
MPAAGDAMLAGVTRRPAPAADIAPRLRVVAAVVWRDGRMLFTRRPPGGPLGLQWEMPGGKIETGETPEGALVRELAEELGVRATAHETLAVEPHDYPHGMRVDVHFIRATFEGEPRPASEAVHDLRWWTPDEVDLTSVLEGDRAFLTRLGARPR